MTIPELLDFRDQNHVFEDMEGGASTDMHYIHGDQTTQWSVTRETANGYLSNVGNARPVSTSSAERSSWSRW